MSKAKRLLSRNDSSSVPWKTVVRRLSPSEVGQREPEQAERGGLREGSGLGRKWVREGA